MNKEFYFILVNRLEELNERKKLLIKRYNDFVFEDQEIAEIIFDAEFTVREKINKIEKEMAEMRKAFTKEELRAMSREYRKIKKGA